ncbi:hypothetical protein QQY66_44135 [Streptomyces sp. DG2A-72]|uniref:hypothetical protein n=1 Tax=Streptomyces sp. DG2A-72 TaxID=3051386 RepID=UPI00265C26B1|nr:hypothetical protein [Streptomyces sp. DG2A-72]MDO0938379.1 hypothetical protein [Streptomyces sp. DG2A-72]
MTREPYGAFGPKKLLYGFTKFHLLSVRSGLKALPTAGDAGDLDSSGRTDSRDVKFWI